MSSFKQFTAIVLCSLLTALPAMPQPQTGQAAGQINAMIPSATRNSTPAKVKEELDWNDLLQTEHSGRVRAGLKDGSILSLGSDSQLRIVQHDSASQQTSLEMDFGKVRSQVMKITKPGGKFEMKTPNAVIGVVGTDFYASFESNTTTVICYKGQVTVTPLNGAHVANNSGQSSAASNSITVSAGQMVQITSEVPPSGFQTTNTPPAVLQASLTATDIPVDSGVTHEGRGPRWPIVGTLIAVGLGVGVGLAVSTSGGSPKTVRKPTGAP